MQAIGFPGAFAARRRSPPSTGWRMPAIPSSAFVKVGDRNAILWFRYRSSTKIFHEELVMADPLVSLSTIP